MVGSVSKEKNSFSENVLAMIYLSLLLYIMFLDLLSQHAKCIILPIDANVKF